MKRTPRPLPLFQPSLLAACATTLLCLSPGLQAEPIPPAELPRPERTSNGPDYSALNPAVFNVDYFRMGLEGGLNSPLMRHDPMLAPLVNKTLIQKALLQVQELQNAGGRADPDDPEEGNIREELSPVAATDRTPLLLGAANAVPILRLHPTPFAPNIVGGSPQNEHKISVVGAVISGGGDATMPNRVTADFATIGGGVNNLAGGDNKFLDAPFSTIAGGRGNRVDRRHGAIGGGINNLVAGNSGAVIGGKGNAARGDYSLVGGGSDNAATERHSTVTGGQKNQATAESASVGGGENNNATGVAATIGGGANNNASGSHAIIPGGLGNVASATGGFAAGTMAQSRHEGSFVWGDFTSAPFASTGPNQFLLRATGNVGIDTDSPSEKLTVQGNIAPATDDKYTLGSGALRWRDLNLSGSVDYVGNLVFADQGNPRMRLDGQGNLHLSGQVFSQSGGQAVAISGSSRPINAGRDYAQEIRSLSSRLQQLESQGGGGLTAPLMQRLANLEGLVASNANNANNATTRTPRAPRTAVTAAGNPLFQQELTALASRVQQLESTSQAAPPPSRGSNTELASINNRVRQIENMALTPKAEFSQLASRVGQLEAQTKTLQNDIQTSPVSASKTELATLTTRLQQLESKPGADPAALQQLAVRLQALEQKPAAAIPSSVNQAELQAINTRLTAFAQQTQAALANMPAAPDRASIASKADLLALTARVDSLAATPNVSKAELNTTFARLQQMITANKSTAPDLRPLNIRLDALEQSLNKRPPTPAGAPADNRALERVDLAISSLSQRQAVSEQNMASIRKQAESALSNTESMRFTVGSLNEKVPGLESRLTSMEQSVKSLAANPAPGNPGDATRFTGLVQSLGQRQSQAEQTLNQVAATQAQQQIKLDQLSASGGSSATVQASVKALSDGQQNLIRQSANYADRQSVDQLQGTINALKRKIAVLEQQPAPAGTTAAAPGSLAGLRAELASVSTQMQQAKRERSAIQRDQLRLLSLENKVKALSLNPGPAGAAAGSNIPSPASTPLVRTGAGAKDVQAMEVLGNLLAVQMKEFQTNQGKSLGPDPASFNALFGNKAPAGTIDSALAEGVALTAIQGLFQILDAQDRRIIQLEEKLAKMADK